MPKIEANGVMVNYVETPCQASADAPVAILMHGWGCNSSTLASIQRVAAESHHVYNIDFPGFGESAEPAGVWGIEEYTQMLKEFIEKLGIQNPVLLGHSFGGRVAISYAGQYPCSQVILVDSAGVKPKRSPKYYFKVYSFKLAKKIAPIILGKEKGQKYIDSQRAKRGSSDYNNASPHMRAIMSKVVNQDLKHFMPKIQAPTLLIWGENDTATPLKDAKIMERLIPGSGLVNFPGCGHYSFLNNPIQFAAVLRSFLTHK